MIRHSGLISQKGGLNHVRGRLRSSQLLASIEYLGLPINDR